MRFATAAGIAGLFFVVSAAAGSAQCARPLDDAVREGETVATDLGENASAITYWMRAPDGWRVVTTVDMVSGRDSDAEQHAVVRFSAVLQPGQSQLISVPVALGEAQQVLRIRRLDDRIEVARLPASLL
jgi:hypothetical protein